MLDAELVFFKEVNETLANSLAGGITATKL